MKIKLNHIVIAGLVAIVGYLGYKFYTGVTGIKKTAEGVTAPVFNIFQQTPAEAITQTGEILSGIGQEIGAEYINQGEGFILPAPLGGEKSPEVTATEDWINLVTGITAANPITAPITPIIGAVLGGTSNIIQSSYKKAALESLPATEWTTPTIPKYTTDYEKEILESAAPSIVQSKIIAGKIW